MDLFTLVVPGDPIPKARPRSGGNFYTPARTRDAEERIRALARNGWRGAPYEGPVGIEVQFYCATRRRTDGDNLLKLVTDALQRGRRPDGGVIADDAQIVDWRARVYRRAPDQEPRTEIRVFTAD